MSTDSRQPVLIISGTNRPGSNSLKVAKCVQRHYVEHKIPTDLFDLVDLPLDIYHPSAYAAKPASFAPLQERVLAAAGMHVVLPEYNGSFPGALKYFIDMLKFPDSFDRRPVAFVGIANGMWGALRAVEQLQMVYGYRNAHVYPDRVFIPTVKTRLNADGHMTDEALDQRLEKQAVGFAAFAGQVGGERV